MKILLTTHQFLPEFSAGTEILTYETAKELQEQGNDISIFTGFPAGDDIKEHDRFDSYSYNGLHITRFAHGKVPMGKQFNIVEAEYNNLFFASYFRNYLKKLKPDLVHFFHLQRLSASAIEVCYELNIPIVMTPTDFWLVCPMNQLRLPDNSFCKGPDKGRVNCLRHYVELTQPLKIVRYFNKLPSWVIRLMIWGLNKGVFSKKWFSPLVCALHKRPAFLEKQMNRLDRMIVPNRFMEKTLTNYGLREEKIVFCPFGISFKYKKKISFESNVPLRIGFIGTLAEHKGPHVLIDAIKLLPRGFPVEVKIYGNRSEFPAYVEKMKISASKDSRIKFCGVFPNSEIGEVFENIDVLVVPSIWYENTPLIIYTAQAAGCPVVASNVQGMAEVVNHMDNGLLFEPGDSFGLANAFQKLVKTPDLLKKLTKNIKKPKLIKEYALELIKIYEEVVNAR